MLTFTSLTRNKKITAAFAMLRRCYSSQCRYRSGDCLSMTATGFFELKLDGFRASPSLRMAMLSCAHGMDMRSPRFQNWDKVLPQPTFSG
jgi:hypothetical protein